MRKIKGIFIVIIIIAITSGRVAAWNFIKALADGVWQVSTVLIPSLFISFTPYLGIDEFIISKIIYVLIILAFTSVLGIFLSKKLKKKIAFIISEVVGLVFSICLFL
ncbi:MAG: hypothetical protein ACYCWE_20350 [Eubacteriales bacterium]